MKTIPFKKTEPHLPLRDSAQRQAYPLHIIKKKRVLADLTFVVDHL